MKKVLLTVLCIANIMTLSLQAAPREKPTQKEKITHRKPKVEKEKPLGEDERDSMLLVSGVGILIAVISALIDPTNLSHVKLQLFAMLAGIQQFIQIMVRSPQKYATQEELVEALIEYLKNQGLAIK